MTGDKLLTAANYYASKKLRVFPCWPMEKAPATTHGCKDATTDLEQITKWWTGPYLYNIGIATGGGIVVLDVDINDQAGKYGDETLDDLEKQYGSLPDTWMCLTGGGGIHYYFASDDPDLTVGVEFAPGLDFRGAGGYVIAPPSVHKNGRTYEWEVNHTPANCALAPLPEWLHRLMLQGKTKDRPTAHTTEGTEQVQEGRRNDVLFKLASSLRAKGLGQKAITAALIEENRSRCSPPLPDREVETIAKSAGRYEQGEVKTSATPRPALVKASEVPYEPPRWTIAPYFQRGKGTLIQGDNGSGKTAFMCAVAAHVTTGNPLLGIPVTTPGDVLMLSVEDDLPVLRGRIEASGGDLDKCHFMTNAAGLTFNSPEVEAAIKEINAKMVIFGPFQAFLGASVDMFRSNETRPELAKLFEMCERNDCACAIIAHMGKSGDKSPVNRSLGSVDIPASMRSILQLTRNPDNEEECVMVHVKCSNAPKGQSIAYTIGDRGGVHWVGFSPMNIDDLATIAKRKEKGVPYDKEPLVQVFNQLVTDRPGGGFWSYEDVKAIGMKLLGVPPFYSVADLKAKLNSAFCRELQEKDGLIVTCGHRAHGGVRGIRIEQYQVPQGYQTAINE